MQTEGMGIPLHQMWNWEYFQQKGYDMIESEPLSLTESHLLQQLLMHNCDQQIDALQKAKHADVIYAPFMGDAYLIALAKVLHLCHTPLVAIAQETWRLDYSSSKLNRLKQMFVRYLAKHGVDRLLFISENVYNQCSEYFDNLEKQIPMKHWGVDIDYYDRFISLLDKSLTNDYVFVTGGANRDFALMNKVSEYENLSFPIYIQTNRCPIEISESSRIRIDKSPKGWDDLMNGYLNSAIIAVPLALNLNYMSGITVVLEGMACRKPILSTISPHYPFNLEKEKVGLYLPFGDDKAWVDAINYLHDNPDEARDMGERGRYIVEHKHNYNLFCKELEKHIISVTARHKRCPYDRICQQM